MDHYCNTNDDVIDQMKHAGGAGFCASTSDDHEHDYMYTYFLRCSLLHVHVVKRRRVCSFIDDFALNHLKAQYFSIILVIGDNVPEGDFHIP